MKTIEDLPVNEWNHGVHMPAHQTEDYGDHAIPCTRMPEIPEGLDSTIGEGEERMTSAPMAN